VSENIVLLVCLFISNDDYLIKNKHHIRLNFELLKYPNYCHNVVMESVSKTPQGSSAVISVCACVRACVCVCVCVCIKKTHVCRYSQNTGLDELSACVSV